MVGNSDVLVAALCTDGKPACVVGVEFGERHFCDVELDEIVVGGLSCNGEEDRCGGNEGQCEGGGRHGSRMGEVGWCFGSEMGKSW